MVALLGEHNTVPMLTEAASLEDMCLTTHRYLKFKMCTNFRLKWKTKCSKDRKNADLLYWCAAPFLWQI